MQDIEARDKGKGTVGLVLVCPGRDIGKTSGELNPYADPAPGQRGPVSSVLSKSFISWPGILLSYFLFLISYF